MVSKEKILNGIKDHLINIHCCRTDLELDNRIAKEEKEPVITNLKIKYSYLLDIRSKLKELLDD